MDPHDADQERRGCVSPSRHPTEGCPRLADELRMDDGTLADVRELRERSDDGPVRRGDDGPAVRRVRRSSRGHDARRGAETHSELEGGPGDGRARLAPYPAVQLHRRALHTGGDAVPNVPRGVPPDRRILRRAGGRRRFPPRVGRAAVRSIAVPPPRLRPRLRDSRRGPSDFPWRIVPRSAIDRPLDRAVELRQRRRVLRPRPERPARRSTPASRRPARASREWLLSPSRENRRHDQHQRCEDKLRGDPERPQERQGLRRQADRSRPRRLWAAPARRVRRPARSTAPRIPYAPCGTPPRVSAIHQGEPESVVGPCRGRGPGVGTPASRTGENPDDGGTPERLRGPGGTRLSFGPITDGLWALRTREPQHRWDVVERAVRAPD